MSDSDCPRLLLPTSILLPLSYIYKKQKGKKGLVERKKGETTIVVVVVTVAHHLLPHPILHRLMKTMAIELVKIQTNTRKRRMPRRRQKQQRMERRAPKKIKRGWACDYLSANNTRNTSSFRVNEEKVMPVEVSSCRHQQLLVSINHYHITTIVMQLRYDRLKVNSEVHESSGFPAKCAFVLIPVHFYDHTHNKRHCQRNSLY